MAHRRARLTVFGRQLLVDRVETEGWTIARAAEAAGVSRQTATKWVRRHGELGPDGLEDRSIRPHRSPRALPRGTVEAILVTRHELGVGPTAWRPSWASRARPSATSCAVTASPAWPTGTGPRGSPSATSANDRASCSTWTSRSSGASPTAAATASAAGAPAPRGRTVATTTSTRSSTT
jgi:hypothetical protein